MLLDSLPRCSPELRDLWTSLGAFLVGIGRDVQEQPKTYAAFKRLKKNFACVEVRPRSGILVVLVSADAGEVKFKEGFARDVSKVGHAGTGMVEIRIRNAADLEMARPLILESYRSIRVGNQ
jgi:predicted transport protein